MSDADELETIRGEVMSARSSASEALSSQVKTIALGVLAIVWLLLGGTEQELSDKFACYTTPLLWIAFVCVVALLADFMQYVFALIESDFALKASLKATRSEDAGFDEGSVLRKLSVTCFIIKLVTAAAAALWLLSIMIGALTH